MERNAIVIESDEEIEINPTASIDLKVKQGIFTLNGIGSVLGPSSEKLSNRFSDFSADNNNAKQVTGSVTGELYLQRLKIDHDIVCTIQNSMDSVGAQGKIREIRVKEQNRAENKGESMGPGENLEVRNGGNQKLMDRCFSLKEGELIHKENVVLESINFLTVMEHLRTEAITAVLHTSKPHLSFSCLGVKYGALENEVQKEEDIPHEVIKVDTSEEEETTSSDEEFTLLTEKSPGPPTPKRPALGSGSICYSSAVPQQELLTPVQKALCYLITRIPLNVEGEQSMDRLRSILTAGLSMIDPETIIQGLSNVNRYNGTHLRATGKKLCQYCKHGVLDKVLHLLVQGCSPTEQVLELEMKTAMHVTAIEGRIDIMICLICKTGGVVDIPDVYQRTPLYAAVNANRKEMAEFLRISGASMNCKDIKGVSLPHVAALKGHCSLISWMVDHGVDINVQDPEGWTPVMWVMEKRNTAMLKHLLVSGANLLNTDKEMNIALHWACFFGSYECAEILLNVESTVNLVNSHGDTPLHIAARQGNSRVVRLLLDHGADTRVQNKAGKRPMEVDDIRLDVFNIIRERHNIGKVSGSYFYENDISNGKEKVPISCINELDSAAPPDFRYMTEIIPTRTVSVNMDLESVQGCNCDTNCDSRKCACLDLAPTHKYYKDDVIIPEIADKEGLVIFECTSFCSCRPTCSNRLVQHGISQPLQLFRTRERGWGVRTLADIPDGSFVLPYTGELISSEEADGRADDTYLFDLSHPGCRTGNCIDAKRCGNIGRFLNHSCFSNLFSMLVLTRHRDADYPGVAFFAKRDIKKMEELTFDYGERYWDAKMKTGLFCLCRYPHCQYREPPKDDD